MISALELQPNMISPQRPAGREMRKAAAGRNPRTNGGRPYHVSPSEPEIAIERERDHWDMARLASGDEQALNSLMERYGNKLLHHLERIVRNRSDAQELVQEAFIRVFKHRLNYNFESRFSTWLYTIGSNLAISLLRWRGRRPEEVPLPEDEEAEGEDSSIATDAFVDPAAMPCTQAQSDEWTDALEHALARLPERLRVPLLLFTLDGYSQAEVAAHVGCSVKAVETRVYHARERLRLEMERILDPSPFRPKARMHSPRSRADQRSPPAPV